jgi:hypothetical protein
MSRTTALRQAIKRNFVPFLRDKGFGLEKQNVQFYTFRKVDSDAVHLFDIQWGKYGSPRFVLNFSKCAPKGLITRGRLAPSQRRTTGGWFRQDRSWLERLFCFSKLYPAEQVVAQLIALFPEVEDFWKSAKIGPHIQLLYPIFIAGPFPPLRLNRISEAFESVFGRREKPGVRLP